MFDDNGELDAYEEAVMIIREAKLQSKSTAAAVRRHRDDIAGSECPKAAGVARA